MVKIFTSNLSNKIFTNKKVLKTLEHISEHGTSFSAGVSLGMSALIRPAAIYLTPDTEKENKFYAMSNSISSALVKFAIVETVALPVEKAIKKIDNNPEKYLKNPNYKGYKFITQIFKLLPGMITAIPKSMITVALIPLITDKLFHIKPQSCEKTNNLDKSKNLSFSGDGFSRYLGRLIDNENIRIFAKNNEHKSSDIAKHVNAATDILLTSASTYNIYKNDKIKQNRKKPLIFNNIISTIITLTFGYGIDRVIKNKNKVFVENFKQINKNNLSADKLKKCIEGLNILRPTVIFAAIYYALLPVISTYISDKTGDKSSFIK